MSKLQILLFLVSISFIFLSIKVYKRKKIWLILFLFLFGGSVAIAFFSLHTKRLDQFGLHFWTNRGADLIIYCSIIFLFYLFFSLYNKSYNLALKQTSIARNYSLSQAIWALEDKKIVFIIPAYNESDNALKVIQEIIDQGHGVVFIDDGSTNDLYKKILKQFSKDALITVKHIVNLGQGAALQTGFSYILSLEKKPEYIVTFDSDGQHCLSDLPHFLAAFQNNKELEIALGSRFLWDTVNMPFLKKVFLKLWIIFTTLFSKLKLTDTHNGYRVIKTSSLPKITITMNGMEHASEILDIISREHLHYQEVPNTIIYTDYSIQKGQKLSNSVKIVRNLFYKRFFQ